MIDAPAVVCIHDVAPRWAGEVETLLRFLDGIGVSTISLVIIPEPFGQRWADSIESHRLLKLCREHGTELILHGLTHQRAGSSSLLSKWIGGHDEFANLKAADAESRIVRGQKVLEAMFGKPAEGFLPPAWRPGPTRAVLGRTSLQFLVEMHRISWRDGSSRSLATWSWDGGRCSAAGYLTDAAGSLLSLRPNATPCVALHPLDVTRGFLPRARLRILSMLESNRTFCRFADLATKGEPRGAVVPHESSADAACSADRPSDDTAPGVSRSADRYRLRDRA